MEPLCKELPQADTDVKAKSVARRHMPEKGNKEKKEVSEKRASELLKGPEVSSANEASSDSLGLSAFLNLTDASDRASAAAAQSRSAMDGAFAKEKWPEDRLIRIVSGLPPLLQLTMWMSCVALYFVRWALTKHLSKFDASLARSDRFQFKSNCNLSLCICKELMQSDREHMKAYVADGRSEAVAATISDESAK